MSYSNEKEVADRAIQMLESALRSKTKNFKSHVQKADSESLKNATAKANVKKYGTKKNGSLSYYMRSLSLSMAKHGFIQNFGVKGRTRSGGSRERHIPKDTIYNFKAHVFNMKATPFIDEAIMSSGVIGFVEDNISEIRLEDLVFYIKTSLEDSNVK